jgi:hypothetical protein
MGVGVLVGADRTRSTITAMVGGWKTIAVASQPFPANPGPPYVAERPGG